MSDRPTVLSEGLNTIDPREILGHENLLTAVLMSVITRISFRAKSNLLYYSIYYTYLLTPWSSVLHEKLTGSAASQEIPRIFGTRRFLTVPTIILYYRF